MTKWVLMIALLWANACAGDRARPSAGGSPSGLATTPLMASAAPLARHQPPAETAAPEPSPPSGPSAAPPGAVTLETRHLRDSRPAKQSSPGVDARTCSFDAEYPAVQGLGGPVEARINALLKPKQPLLESSCDFATSYEISYRVAWNEAGYLSIVFDHNWCCGAHPSYTKHFVNVNARDGKALTFARLFRTGAAKAISARLVPLVRKALVDDPDPSEEWLAELSHDPSDFWLERGGVRFSLFNAAPHAIQAAFEEGFIFSCRELEGLAVRPGPLDAFCASPRL